MILRKERYESYIQDSLLSVIFYKMRNFVSSQENLALLEGKAWELEGYTKSHKMDTRRIREGEVEGEGEGEREC